MNQNQEFGLRRADESDYERLVSLYSAHLRVLASFNGEVDPQAPLQRDWLTRPDELFSYVIEVQGRGVGFVLVTAKRYTQAIGEWGDHHLYELFVEESQRGSGLAAFAVAQVLDSHRGRWSLSALKDNGRAVAFWDRLLDLPGLGLVRGVRDGIFRTYRFDTSGGYPPRA